MYRRRFPLGQGAQNAGLGFHHPQGQKIIRIVLKTAARELWIIFNSRTHIATAGTRKKGNTQRSRQRESDMMVTNETFGGKGDSPHCAIFRESDVELGAILNA